jgi:phage tail-like protein
MTEEFKNQVFKTGDQWNSGLLYRLEMIKDGGIALYSTPLFNRWVQALKIKGITNPGAVTVGPCGQVYFVDKDTCRIYRYDTETRVLEQLPCIIVCDPGDTGPVRIRIDRMTIWVLDIPRKSLKAYSRENFQVKYIIDNLDEPVDFGMDTNGNQYILDKSSTGGIKILTYDIHGRFMERHFDTSCLKDPAALAVGKGDMIYVIDLHEQCNGFFTFNEAGECSGPIDDFTSIKIENPKGLDTGFKPTMMAIDPQGNLFAADPGSGLIHRFDADGSHIGKVTIPGFIGTIHGLAVDFIGNLFVSTNQGIAFFSGQQRYTKEKGIYYTKTLDSGMHECRWHRLLLNRDLPPRTVLEVYYYASDDENLKNDIQDNLADKKKSAQQKAEFIDGKIYRWEGPVRNPEDMLFREAAGRYLWLRVELSTYDETVRPTVFRMQVYYPRQSYLRYLPAVYQEDPVSGEFLERFLSLFETQFYGLETEITQIAKYFDPGSAPGNFLTWLGTWLNLALEEEWEESTKRRLIKEAVVIYKQKGTPRALKRFIEIYTGETPVIQEHAAAVKPMVLGGTVRLGVNTIVLQTPVRGFRLGDDSILGRTALREEAMSPEDPFLVMAHRFTVILHLPDHEYKRWEKGLKRILDEEKPAHTEYTLYNIEESRVGIGAYVGINTGVSDYRPMKLGIDSTLGTGLVVYNTGETVGRLDRYSRIGRDLKLI